MIDDSSTTLMAFNFSTRIKAPKTKLVFPGLLQPHYICEIYTNYLNDSRMERPDLMNSHYTDFVGSIKLPHPLLSPAFLSYLKRYRII